MTSDQLVWADRASDRSRASNGVSRYQSYLQDRGHLFAAVDDPIGYAITAWKIATSPVMTPGYVEWRADLHTVTVQHDGEGRMVGVLELRLPRRPSVPNPLYSDLDKLADWDRQRSWSGSGDDYAYHAPRAERDALLITARLIVHLDDTRLPDPGDTGTVDYRVAMRAVDHLVGEINRAAMAPVGELRGVAR